MRNVTNFFLANLALSDLCVGVFCVLPNLSKFLSPYWLLGKVLCKLYYFIQCTSYTASILILTVISLERYFAIIHPMLNKRITRMCRLRAVVVTIWTCAALYGMPNLIAYDIYRVNGTNGMLEFCVITGRWTIDMEVYSVINFVVLYVSPLLLISIMYIRISHVLWKSGRNMGVTASTYFSSKTNVTRPVLAEDFNHSEHSAELQNETASFGRLMSHPVGDVTWHDGETRLKRECSVDANRRKRAGWFSRRTISQRQWTRSVDEQDRVVEHRYRCCAKSGDEQQRNKQRQNEASKKGDNVTRRLTNPLARRRKVIRLLICIIVSFAICVLPHHIRLLWQNWSMTAMSLSFSHMLIPPTTFLFFYANSALNPFLYALLSVHFRRAFYDLMPSWCHRCKDKAAYNGTVARESRMSNLRTSTLENGTKPYLQSAMNTTLI
ncbi:hypothetical protein LSH36_305g01023 [Paralvinella palmiformis]|uniref:G-protein coupled receptors family 1 profile domain-containing protein n=1 Tax=Paralvinella palmiformis TaxID=53620 RepID=A0AAD9JI66_9ANNE|nr:hypothetical protein LSH36_305g01023 [Paralvinella palmiformis]